MEQFTHMLVSTLNSYGVIAGTAYMIGTKQECRVYQMQHGLRAYTTIIPF
jgi:hypothetical protein